MSTTKSLNVLMKHLCTYEMKQVLEKKRREKLIFVLH